MNIMKGRLPLAALFILFEAEIFSQKILDPEFRPPDVRFDNFAVMGGEASQTSTSIFIDSRGFLWCGTESGLYRNDGARYVEYRSPDGGHDPNNRTITRIFEDSGGTIWAGTANGLIRVDQASGSMFLYIPDSTDFSGQGNAVRSINEDSN